MNVFTTGGPVIIATAPGSPISVIQGANANGQMTTVAVTAAEANYAAPANAVGVILESESGNADNLRWGVSNGAGSILSSTVGLILEPGRDTGFVPVGAGTFLHVIAVAGGTNNAGIQWVMSS